MNLTRRGFLLGVVKTGALAILPIPLLKAVPIEVPEVISPTEDYGKRFLKVDVKLLSTGELRSSQTSCLQNGLYFNNKFIPAQGFVLNIRRDFAELSSPGKYEQEFQLGLLDLELEANDVFLQGDPFKMFEDHSEIKVDLVSHSTRYTGGFILTEYSLNSGDF